MVYAHVGFASDGREESIAVDYSKSVTQVYEDFARQLQLKKGVLNMLRYVSEITSPKICLLGFWLDQPKEVPVIILRVFSMAPISTRRCLPVMAYLACNICSGWLVEFSDSALANKILFFRPLNSNSSKESTVFTVLRNSIGESQKSTRSAQEVRMLYNFVSITSGLDISARGISAATNKAE